MNGWFDIKQMLCRVEWAGSYRTHVRPIKQEFFTVDQNDLVWSRRSLPGTGCDGATYGTSFCQIGEIAFGLCPQFDQPSDEIKFVEKRNVSTYFIDPAKGCPQCGDLSSENDCGAALEFIRMPSVRDSEEAGITMMQYANIVAWLIKNNRHHPVLVSRCCSCRGEYKGLFDHIQRRSGNKKFQTKQDDWRQWRPGDEENQIRASKYLLAIGKSEKSSSEKTMAKKSIMRHLRKRFHKLSKAELTFFQMFAGVNAIKTQGGKYGTRNRNAA